jgi:hypothetical protein
VIENDLEDRASEMEFDDDPDPDDEDEIDEAESGEPLARALRRFGDVRSHGVVAHYWIEERAVVRRRPTRVDSAQAKARQRSTMLSGFLPPMDILDRSCRGGPGGPRFAA